jgi:integrase
MELPKESNPQRAVATYDRYLRTVEALQALAVEAPQRRGRRKWVRMELALVIAEATGCRRGNLRGLRWADWDFDQPTVHWRAEFDKRGYDRVMPVADGLAAKVKELRLQLEAFGDGWMFPCTRDEPWPVAMFDQGLRKAEAKAGVPKLKGSLWHAYRRKWATERKHMARADVKVVGGWRDDRTLATCYEQADIETVRAVVNCPTKLMSKKFGTAG